MTTKIYIPLKDGEVIKRPVMEGLLANDCEIAPITARNDTGEFRESNRIGNLLRAIHQVREKGEARLIWMDSDVILSEGIIGEVLDDSATPYDRLGIKTLATDRSTHGLVLVKDFMLDDIEKYFNGIDYAVGDDYHHCRICYYLDRTQNLMLKNERVVETEKEYQKRACDRAMFYYRPDNADLLTIVSIFENGEYDLSKAGRAKTIIDIGAHIGVFVAWAKLAFPEASIYAYEPSPRSHELLRLNIELNQLKGVRIFQSAVTDREGIRNLYIHRNWNWLDSLVAETGEAVPVNAITLQQVFDLNGIERCDVLKIDVEGSEWDILSVLPDDYWRRIGAIVLETHDFVMPGIDQQIYDLLIERGFRCEYTKRQTDVSVIWAVDGSVPGVSVQSSA